MYKLSKNLQGEINSVTFRQGNMLFGAPFVPDNTDYAEFKKAVTAGAELQDADGVKMTAKAAKAFIATLP